MGKDRSATSTQTTAPDASTSSWIDRYRQLAADNYNTASQTPTSGPLADAGGYFSQLAGNLPAGMERGLGGIDQYTNPYESQVVSGVEGDFDRQRALASNAAADQATKAGAFGGSRSAVLQSGLLGDVNRNEASTLANVRQTGYTNAADQLMQDRNRAAGLGVTGAQGLLGYGQYLDSRTQNALDQYRQGLSFGGTTTYGKQTLPYNDLQSLIGLGIQGAGVAFGKPPA